MGRFIIEQDFWEVFPKAKIGVLLCSGLDNTRQDARYAAMLAAAQEEAKRHFSAAEFSQNPVVQTWRQAFGLFRTKKGARSSIEALLKRVHHGNGVGSINPLVDIYNAVSLRYAVPCGGEDLSAIQGDIRLTKAVGTEAFITLGSEASEPPMPGELVYQDDAGAICRCLNWRESARTMLQPGTTDAFMCMENVDPAYEATFREALAALQAHIQEHLGGKCSLHVLDQENWELRWSSSAQDF